MSVPRWTRSGAAAALALVLAAAVATAALHAPGDVVAHASSLFPRAMVLVTAASIAGLVWLLPPWVTISTGAVLSPVAANWGLLGVPRGMAPDRLLLVGGVAAVLLRAPGTRGLPPLRFRPTHAVLALVLVYATISAAFAGTLTEKDPFFHLFDAFGVLPFLVFFVAPVVFGEPRSRSLLLVALVVLGAYLGLTALFEATKVDGLVFPRYIVSSEAGDTSGRAYGVFREPVSNGCGLFVCGVAAVIAAVGWRRQAARIFAGLTAALCAVGTFFTLERSVWLGALVAVVVTAAVCALRLRPRATGVLATAAAVAAAVLVAGLAVHFVPSIADHARKRANDQATVWDRQNLARAAENMIEARPLLGFGWNTFEEKSLEYFQQSPDFPINPNLVNRDASATAFSIHNAFLEYGVTLGLVGTTLWLLGLALAVGGAVRARGSPDLRRWRFGLLPVLVFYLVIENAVPPALFPNLAVWIWLGVVWSGYSSSADGGRRTQAVAHGSH